VFVAAEFAAIPSINAGGLQRLPQAAPLRDHELKL
jgi:hypothetical protein